MDIQLSNLVFSMIKEINIRDNRNYQRAYNWRQNVEALFPLSVFFPLPLGKDGSGDDARAGLLN